MIADLPELGRLTANRSASWWVSLHFNRDSGHNAVTRHIYGGRAPPAQCAYMAAITAVRHNPVIKEFYERLPRQPETIQSRHHRFACANCSRSSRHAS